MIGSTKQQLDKFGARVVKLARINLGARQKIDGKMRVTNNTGAVSYTHLTLPTILRV